MDQSGGREQEIEWPDDLSFGFQVVTDLAVTIGDLQSQIETYQRLEEAVDGQTPFLGKSVFARAVEQLRP